MDNPIKEKSPIAQVRFGWGQEIVFFRMDESFPSYKHIAMSLYHLG